MNVWWMVVKVVQSSIILGNGGRLCLPVLQRKVYFIVLSSSESNAAFMPARVGLGAGKEGKVAAKKSLQKSKKKARSNCISFKSTN